MDTSEQIIKMYDCPEIQDGWKPSEGDWCIRNWKQGLCRDEHLEVFGSDDIQNLSSVRICNEIKHSSIWLPRQDQLQGMIPKSWSLSYLPQDKKYTFHLYGPQTFTGQTPEQALIQGVMYELYIKRWIGEKWEKEA